MAGKMNEDRLQNAFQYVRQTFFPRWDRDGQWKVVDNTLCSEPHDMEKEVGDILALCCEVNKRIFIYEIPENEDSLHALLIHEICHVNGPGHGKKWARNMNKAYVKGVNNSNVSEDLTVLIDCDKWESCDESLE